MLIKSAANEFVTTRLYEPSTLQLYYSSVLWTSISVFGSLFELRSFSAQCFHYSGELLRTL